MLSLDQYPADFSAPSFSAEMHGDEPRTVMSIYVEAVVHAANLGSFKAGLQNAFWYRPAINDSARLDDNGNLHELVRRFPTVKTIQFDDKLGRGYTLTIKGDLVDEEKTWPDMEVGKVSIEPQDGGTARLRFRLQDRGDDLEAWVGLMNQGRTITLMPPADKPLPAEHPDAKKNGDDSHPLAGSLEFGPGADGDNPLAGSDITDADDDPDDGVSHDDPDGNGEDTNVDAHAEPRPRRQAKAPAAKSARKRNGAAAGVH